ncbi:MAG TPA: hypothetical protein VMT70_09580 [Vicinamibacteria bacterium]|nr:hypothetical protein [Vicinamibacteria bacterium]
MTDDGEPGELLGMADRLLRRADPATAGLWPRASALLALRALEESLHRLWERRALDLRSCSMRTQLICLRSYLDDTPLAARAGHAWSALSRACHHHPYELAPTSGELHAWFSVVSELARRVGLPSETPPPGRS